MTGGSYIDVFQVQGVQILTVSLPQYRRPALPRDGTSQHSALANCDSGNSHFLVIGKVEQVHICWWEGRNDSVRWGDENWRTDSIDLLATVSALCKTSSWRNLAWEEKEAKLFINVSWYFIKLKFDGSLTALKSEVKYLFEWKIHVLPTLFTSRSF